MTIDEDIFLTVVCVSRCHTFIRKANLIRKYIGLRNLGQPSRNGAMIGNLVRSSKLENRDDTSRAERVA